MRRLLKVILLIVITNSSYGQIENIESLMTRRYVSCEDIFQNVQYLIPEFYEKGSTDTLNAIVRYWEKNCGPSEVVTRCKIILSVSQGNFSEKIYDTNILNNLIVYKNRYSYAIPYGYMRYGLNRYEIRPDTLDKFTMHLAKSLLKHHDLKPIEVFFLRIYSNDFENTFAMLRTEAFDGTILQELYTNEIRQFDKQPLLHGDYLLGVWIPEDNLNIVGTHPFLGIRGGIKYKKLTVDLTLGFKFGRSPSVYQVFENDSLWNTAHFFGGYFGIDGGFGLLKLKRSNIDLIGGIAYDGFDALQINGQNSNNDITKSINSLNLNIGLGYKFNFNSWNYLGIDLKYNFVDFKNRRGTDLSGNAITVNLIYGICGNRYSINKLKELDYTK